MKLGRGLSNADLAAHLLPGPAPVKTHVARIFSKLGLRDRAPAVVLAYELDLMRPGMPPGEFFAAPRQISRPPGRPAPR